MLLLLQNRIEKVRKGEKQLAESKSIYFRVVKRLMDLAAGLIGTVFIFIPVYLIIAIFYQFGKNKGPVIFKQTRLGKNGKAFKIYKFRSMVTNSEEILKENQELYQKYVANSYKLPAGEDPRLTTIGGFIRKTSIDEIPQFFNILKGDMSLIGPRPIIPVEIEEYTPAERPELLSVKPGALGWWQVSGRSNINYPERCEVELYYVRHVSLKLDFEILFKSVVKILDRDGAH